MVLCIFYCSECVSLLWQADCNQGNRGVSHLEQEGVLYPNVPSLVDMGYPELGAPLLYPGILLVLLLR